MGKIRILIVDDSPFNRKAIREMLEDSHFVEVVGTAVDGEDAMKRVIELKPDMITLDLEMPRMDGFTFLRIMMSNMPTPTIVISSRDESGFIFKAMELGAVDFVAKPTHMASHDLYNIKEELLRKVAEGSNVNIGAVKSRKAIELGLLYTAKARVDKPYDGRFMLVAIGSSTGGPAALTTLFSQLPKDTPAAIAVSQHMPPGFTRSFAERLNKFSPFKCEEAVHGAVVRQGKILVAPGGCHIGFVKSGSNVSVSVVGGRNEKYVPSVDYMFKSASEMFGPMALGVVLTGMGNDGKEGVKAIKAAGGHVFAQSESTSVIFGMPKEAISTGVVDRVLDLDSMPQAIKDHAVLSSLAELSVNNIH